MGNTFGSVFRITTFGESHGPAIGVVVDGCPAGLYIDRNFLDQEMQKRRPGQSSITSSRREEDDIEILSGILDGKSTGSPIALLIRNRDQKPEDYDNLKNVYRPSHADFTWQQKYGIRDHRGGGRSSARETAARVAAGAIAQLYLKNHGISTSAYVSQVGHIRLQRQVTDVDLSLTDSSIVRCPDAETAEKMIELIEEVKKSGDTIGGTISCVIKGCRPGLGEPVFQKLQAALAHAMLGINAAHGFDYGAGFEGIEKRGSELNDAFVKENESITTLTNHSGGIQGGLSNGNDIFFRVLFKPVSTLMLPQKTVTHSGEETEMQVKGRHDPCVLPRAVAVVKAMAALVITDFHLLNRIAQLNED